MLSLRQELTLQRTRIEFLTLDVKNKTEEIDAMTKHKLTLIDENDQNIAVGDGLKRHLDETKKNNEFNEE